MANAWDNTFGAETRKEEWETKLQERLAENNKWKEVCKVVYTNGYILHNPYKTDAAVQSGTRGDAYVHQPIVVTDDDCTISTMGILPQQIDRADLAQQTYVDNMELADSQGVLINEYLETAMLAEHAQWTDFDNASIGGSAGDITVSETNIDDIITGMKREIREANGEALMDRNGAFIIWRPADFELLEKYASAQGFNTADDALKNGIKQGFKYGGVEHYSSNKITAGHLFGGVKKCFTVGILSGTYGKVYLDEEPATTGGAISAIAVISRVDFIFKAWYKTAGVIFDILVS
jgi:hypothetical protein